MLDENMVLPYEEATEYKPLPEDVYTVQLLDVTSKELESYDSKKARLATPALAPVMETKLSFQFVLLEGKTGMRICADATSLKTLYLPLCTLAQRGRTLSTRL